MLNLALGFYIASKRQSPSHGEHIQDLTGSPAAPLLLQMSLPLVLLSVLRRPHVLGGAAVVLLFSPRRYDPGGGEKVIFMSISVEML